MCANFMVFDDVVREEPYDLWIADEAWELDFYLHENPELKRAAYAWLTDFVGWLPMPDGDEREAALTADYNAEMLEHIERYPRIRDRAIFVGNADDVVGGRVRPGAARDPRLDRAPLRLRGLRDRLRRRRAGPRAAAGGARLRACRRRSASSPSAARGSASRCSSGWWRRSRRRARRCRDLRMIVVAGPRIDPAGLPSVEGLEIRAYVHDLYRHLAACDLAVVQGGLTTAMELTAAKRPFLFFPLRHHFEQNFHVRHRLERYGAGRAMDFETDGPAEIAAAIAAEIGREVDYRDVETDGAARAARSLADLLR